MFLHRAITLLPLFPLHAIDKRERLLARHALNRACLASKSDAIAAVGHLHDFGAKRGANKLRAGLFRNALEQRSDGSAILGIKVGVDLVKDDHGRALGPLEGKYEAQGAEAW